MQQLRFEHRQVGIRGIVVAQRALAHACAQGVGPGLEVQDGEARAQARGQRARLQPRLARQEGGIQDHRVAGLQRQRRQLEQPRMRRPAGRA